MRHVNIFVALHNKGGLETGVYHGTHRCEVLVGAGAGGGGGDESLGGGQGVGSPASGRCGVHSAIASLRATEANQTQTNTRRRRCRCTAYTHTRTHLRRWGSMKMRRSISRRCMKDQPLFCFTIRSLGMNERCDTSSSHEKAKPGHAAGCSAWNADAKAVKT